MERKPITSEELQRMIIGRIESSEYLPGEAIPSERRFAELYGVSRQTIRNAIDRLVSQRYLYRVQGKGTFVKKPDYNKVALGVLNESENASFTSLVRNFGIEISNKLLGKGSIQGKLYFAGKLSLSPEAPIYGIHRIRYGNKEPLAVEYTYLPQEFFPDIQNYNFEQISLYDYMASKGHLPCSFQETMVLMEANDKVARHLQLEPNSIVNHIEILGRDHNGTLVEYTESYSRPDKLEVRFVTNNNGL